MRKVLAVALALALSGCATLPTRGPVLVGGPITVEQRTEVDYLPAGPADGATQREILDGFIAAGSAPQNNFRIARSFLTESAALDWRPVNETVVRGIYTRVAATSSTRLTYTASIVARIDDVGVFTPITARQQTTWEFGFTQVNGEWRLDEVPDLTLVSEAAFASAYDEYTVYFFNRDRTTFIPDVRIFARQADPVTSVTRAVLAGPSRFLPNAETAFPAGTALGVAPVSVVSGRASVDVTDAVQQSSIADQQDMLSQLGVSLGQLSDVTSTALSVDQIPLAISAIPGFESNPRVDDRPLIVYDGLAGYIENGELTPLSDIGSRIVNLKPTAVSYDADLDTAVVGTRVGVYFVGDRTEQVSARPSTVDPQIGGARSVWWVSPSSPDEVSISTGGSRLTVGGPWSPSARIVGLEVSREDARVAIAVNDRGKGAVYVASISSDEDRRPTGIGGFRRLTVAADAIVDLAWADATHVAVLANKAGVIHAELATVGGGSTLLGQPQNPVRISGGNTGAAGLVVIAQNGQLWRPRGTGWQSTGVPADVLATQH